RQPVGCCPHLRRRAHHRPDGGGCRSLAEAGRCGHARAGAGRGAPCLRPAPLGDGSPAAERPELRGRPMRNFVIAVLLLLGTALPAVAGPKIERIKTPLGIEVWFVREPSIPILSLQATWRGGSSSDPAGQEGLAQLMTGLLNEGAGDLSADDFQIA